MIVDPSQVTKGSSVGQGSDEEKRDQGQKSAGMPVSGNTARVWLFPSASSSSLVGMWACGDLL